MKNVCLACVVGLAVPLLVAGCDSDSSACGTVTPCGGNIVADWTIKETCLTFSGAGPLAEFCPSATINGDNLNFSGMVSYRADMTYSGNLTLAGSISMTVPSSCLLINGIQLTCSQLDMVVKMSQMEMPDPSIQSISCSGSGDCVCTAQMVPQTSVGTGTYTTQGTQIVENGTTTSQYCVKGSALHFMTSSMPMGSFTASGELILGK